MLTILLFTILTQEAQKTTKSSNQTFLILLNMSFINTAFHKYIETKHHLFEDSPNFVKTRKYTEESFMKRADLLPVKMSDDFLDNIESLQEIFEINKSVEIIKNLQKITQKIYKLQKKADILLNPMLYMKLSNNIKTLFDSFFQIITFASVLEKNILSEVFPSTNDHNVEIKIEEAFAENMEEFLKGLKQSDDVIQKYLYEQFMKDISRKFNAHGEVIVSKTKLKKFVSKLVNSLTEEEAAELKIFGVFKKKFEKEEKKINLFLKRKELSESFIFLRENDLPIHEAIRVIFPILETLANKIKIILLKGDTIEDDYQKIEFAVTVKKLGFMFYCERKDEIDGLLLDLIDRRITKFKKTFKTRVIYYLRKLLKLLLMLFPYKFVGILLRLIFSDQMGDIWEKIFSYWKDNAY